MVYKITSDAGKPNLVIEEMKFDLNTENTHFNVLAKKDDSYYSKIKTWLFNNASDLVTYFVAKILRFTTNICIRPLI